MKIRVYYEVGKEVFIDDFIICDRYFTGKGDEQTLYVYSKDQCIATYQKDKWVKVVVV